MTSIVSVPFKDGVMIATDTRATEINKLEKFVAENKTTNNLAYNLGSNVEVFVSGTGISVGTELLFHPFLIYLQNYCKEKCIDLNAFLYSGELIQFLNNIGSEWCRTSSRPNDLQDHWACILTIKTKRLIVTLSGGVWGHCESDPIVYDDKEQNKHFICNGSGGRYLLGAVLVQNHVRPWIDKDENEAIDWFRNYFGVAIQADLGSSIAKGGLNVRVVYKDPCKKSQNIHLK